MAPSGRSRKFCREILKIDSKRKKTKSNAGFLLVKKKAKKPRDETEVRQWK
jgi:hypothetical protein